MRVITIDEFMQEYAPMENPVNAEADYHGLLLGKEGPEHHRVLTFMQETPDQVWTLVDKGEGEPRLHSGFTTVQAVGYVVTRAPAEGVVEVVG